MNLTTSLKARLVEILINLPARERKIVLEELQETVRIISLEYGVPPADPSKAPYRSDLQGGLIYWN